MLALACVLGVNWSNHRIVSLYYLIVLFKLDWASPRFPPPAGFINLAFVALENQRFGGVPRLRFLMSAMDATEFAFQTYRAERAVFVVGSRSSLLQRTII